MKKIMRRGLSAILVLILVVGLLPVTAFAAVDSSGKPKDVNNSLVLSIYTGTGFPGEPAVYDTSNYKNIASNFSVRSGATFANSAKNQLDWNEIKKDIVQGASSYNTTVWGVYNTTGTDKYFLDNATIIKPENEAKIIRAIKTDMKNKSDADVLAKYEIIWYVIKLQHSRSVTEWHIDGVIKEKQYISINYYGNGNTSGSAPLGTTTHVAGESYKVLSQNTMTKVINGVEVAFLGWSAKADGTGEEAGFYQPGDVINPTESISLYAMWDTTTQYTATVNTYLDGKLTSDDEIHDHGGDLYLSTDEVHYYGLTEGNTGVYTAKITGNGKFYLYRKNADGSYTKIGNHQLTIYNQNGSLDVHHYSVTYDPNEGAFAAPQDSEAYFYGEAVNAIKETPTREGYRFMGWANEDGQLIQPGEAVTGAISEPITLTAQWEETVNVTVNVTVNHAGGDGYDQAPEKDHVDLTLASRENSGSPYLEIGEKLSLTKTSHEGFNYSVNGNVTKYEGYTLSDMPGGEREYTVVTSKSGYETTVNYRQDANGDWIIDVEMTYKPSNFDLNFTVEVDEDVPAAYMPKAAIVKVTFWATGKGCWEIITQQAGGEPGVRVDIDPNSRTGSGSYPVWKYESNGETPYGYRIEVTSFVYPDGTIVPVSNVLQQDVQWTDQVYTATVEDVTGGRKYVNLDGAYYDQASDSQKGTLNAVITMDLHDVTFDAQGGKVNGKDSQKVEDQYQIPGFKDYIPVREGGYTFAGWYEDQACTVPAVEGKDLTADITLYAKWNEPITVEGNVIIADTYILNGETVHVNGIDKATEAVVVLQEIRNGSLYEVDSQNVTLVYGNDGNGTGSYSFSGIPNDGKEYRIQLLLLNYTTGYDNESDGDISFSAGEYGAVFAGDNVADVHAHLTFVPPSYIQEMIVNAEQIGAGFRPEKVLAKIIYRDTGDNHPYNVITQHGNDSPAPHGVEILLSSENGTGSGSESIWKWHTDGTLYEYQMNITKVDGADFDSDAAPYYIQYTEPVYWDNGTNMPSGTMVATLIPKQYSVTFNLNAGADPVTGMDAYKIQGTDAEDSTALVSYAYRNGHTWSFATEFNALPQREGYTFLGWDSSVSGVTAGSNGNVSIPANVQENVVLTARWERITYDVTTTVSPNGGGTATGANTYSYGSEVTVEATPADGYTFLGWYENDELVSNNTSYTFQIFADRDLVAMFSLDQHTVTTGVKPVSGGTTSGDGTYDYGTDVTLTAVPNPGYTFLGWYRNDELVSSELSFQVTVTENLSYVALFQLNQHTVTTEASPAEGGTTSGDGTFGYGARATVTAEPKPGYTFAGWFENGTLVSEDTDYIFTVEGDRTLTAVFESISYTVTANAERGGKAEGTATYHYGETATVKATVDDTFTFSGWYEGTELVCSDLEYSFTVTSDRTLTAKFSKNGYNITAVPTTGGTVDGSGYYEEGETAVVNAYPDENYMFRGWFEDGVKVSDEASYSFTVTSNRTLKAEFARAHTIATVASPEWAGVLTGAGVYEYGTVATVTAVESAGYYFAGWYDEQGNLYTAEKEFELAVVQNRTFTAKFEAKVSYRCDYVYIFGYNDSKIGAEGPLLRGELSQMIYRLVKQNTGVGNGNISFTDTAGKWFESGVSYMASKGAINRDQQNAYPFASVTRGETYKMICLGLGFTNDPNLSFSQYATILRNSGFISGDGAVTAKIKRYEFCALFNAILGRTGYELIDTQGNPVTHETYGYTDLDPSAGYYRTMLIATSTFTNGRVDLVKRIQRNTYDFTN